MVTGNSTGATGPWKEIVGLVRDSKYLTLSEPPTPVAYLPLQQNHETGMTLHVRASGNPSSILAAVRNQVQSIEKNLPVNNPTPMNEWIMNSLYAARMGAILLGIFAALIFAYSELRGLAHVIQPQPFYTPQLNLDKWLFGGHVPTVEMQGWWWTGSMHWYDHLLIDVGKLHYIVPTLLAFLLWMRRRALFFRFASSMLVLCFLFVAALVWRRSWRWWVIVPAALYPLALSFARVYTGDHYVIDLLAGYAYAAAAFFAVGWYWRRHELPQ